MQGTDSNDVGPRGLGPWWVGFVLTVVLACEGVRHSKQTRRFFQEPTIMNATDQTAMNGRIQNGTFALGNKAAAGRSSRAAELRRAFIDAVSVEYI